MSVQKQFGDRQMRARWELDEHRLWWLVHGSMEQVNDVSHEQKKTPPFSIALERAMRINFGTSKINSNTPWL